MPDIKCASVCAIVAACIVIAGCSKESPTPAAAPSASTAVTPGEALAKNKGCLVCHGVAKAGLGPSYQEVARKYAGDNGAVTRLIRKVKEGGNGVWGTPPMPPQTHVTDEEAKTIVEWVLSLQ